MISIKEKQDCCGCYACEQRCPKRCIAMAEDSEGFCYPKVDEAVCVDCGLCEKICPMKKIGNINPVKPLHTFIAKNKNVKEQMQSSSGGVFILLAKQVICHGGIVFGAAFDNDWNVIHKSAVNESELNALLKSKYVQSNIGETYVEAERFLKEGMLVMYVGTPCQIFGLKSYLRKDYVNLLTVDFLCHGVPSPGVWRKYLKELVNKLSARSAVAGKNTVLSFSLKSMPVITGIDFREKAGFGWEKYGFVVRGKVGPKADKNSVLLSYNHNDNPFMKGFLTDTYLRPSCYFCKFKNGKATSDITLADCWPVRSLKLTFLDDKGVSMLMINTEKGDHWFNCIKPEKVEIPYEKAYKAHGAFHPLNYIPVKRYKFFSDCYKGNYTLEEWVRCELKTKAVKRINANIKEMARDFICNLLLEAHKIKNKQKWLK